MKSNLTKEILQEARGLAEKFIKFNSKASSPYHAVAKAEELLLKANFIQLQEEGKWKLESGKSYFFKRGCNSALVAFTLPNKLLSDDTTAFKFIGTHTDSPCIRLAPVFDNKSGGFHNIVIQTYGGGLWHTWLDRGLYLGGRVVLRTKDGLQNRLYHSKKAVGWISNLAIHLVKDRSKLVINKETDLRPMIATELMRSFQQEGKDSVSVLREMISSELGCQPDEIVNFDLCFADTQETQIVGAYDEFIGGPRMDNLYSFFSSIEAIIRASTDHNKSQSNDVNMIVGFDHEEIGSETYVGANSVFLRTTVDSIIRALGVNGFDSTSRILRRSLLISADMAHSVHPNCTHIHQPNHCPVINQGTILKVNCNGRYTTDAQSGAIAKEIAYRNKLPLGEFIVKQDSPCGSTIGPMLSSKLGCLSFDVGCSQTSMHSIREIAGVIDFYHYINFFQKCFETEMADIIPKGLE